MQDAVAGGGPAAEALPAEGTQGGSGPAAWDDDEDDELVNLQQQGWVRTANSHWTPSCCGTTPPISCACPASAPCNTSFFRTPSQATEGVQSFSIL